MNERIRELMAEVGMSVDYLTNTKQIVLIEKFAQLIVRECCDIVHRKTDESIRVVMAIEQHFGVEE